MKLLRNEDGCELIKVATVTKLVIGIFKRGILVCAVIELDVVINGSLLLVFDVTELVTGT